MNKLKKENAKIAFTEMTTVYGGTDGVKLFITNQIMESVYRFEDSGHELVSMEIQTLYINRKHVIKDLHFRTVKLYGALFDYLGYAADVGYTNGCCVPQLIFDTLHNPNEKNPTK